MNDAHFRMLDAKLIKDAKREYTKNVSFEIQYGDPGFFFNFMFFFNEKLKMFYYRKFYYNSMASFNSTLKCKH